MKMNHRQRAIVRIGVSGARIVAVTRQRIDYIDMEGQEQSIDLEECARAWGSWRDDRSREFLPQPGATEHAIGTWNARCVGQRGALDNPPWAEFANERKTRFEFQSYEALYEELLKPLKRPGWHTFDAN
jgi:hypothetical protein